MGLKGADPVRDLYWAVVSRPRISLDTSVGGMMLLQGGGHEQTQARQAEVRWRRGGAQRASGRRAGAGTLLGASEDRDDPPLAARGVAGRSGSRTRGDSGHARAVAG